MVENYFERYGATESITTAFSEERVVGKNTDQFSDVTKGGGKKPLSTGCQNDAALELQCGTLASTRSCGLLNREL